MKIYIGTSGYSYQHWADGVFYPEGLSSNKWLAYYAKYFDTVELNVTFYRLPNEKMFHSWYKRTPDKFYFALKGNRFITHIKKLNDCEDAVDNFLKLASVLKEKLIIILWQLPPSLKINSKKLDTFCKLLKNYKKINCYHAFEFRHKTWFSSETYEILKKYNYGLCIAHSSRWPCIEEITSDFLYLRFHGGEVLYGSEYSLDELKEWAEKVKKWHQNKKIKILFSYFNNDAYGFAVKNALEFRKLLVK
jgi:uncharacterized protein YecE (DUF72 family)